TEAGVLTARSGESAAASVRAGSSARRDQGMVVPVGRMRSSSRRSPASNACRIAAESSPRSSSRRSAWNTSQGANGPSAILVPDSPDFHLPAARFLNTEMNGDSLDLSHRAHDLYDFTMRDVAIGLDDHLAAARLGAVTDGLPGLLKRCRG